MNSTYDIPDSTDWLKTSLSAFEPLEAALRCQVCKDFYDTPMITTCSHTFCSLCIRRCLASDGKCPICRSSDQADKLRKNGAVQEIVDSFQAARPAALKLAREDVALREEHGAPKRMLKRKLDDTDLEEAEEQRPKQSRRTRSQNRVQDSSPPRLEVIDLDEDYEDDNGLVKCPVCNIRMKEESIWSHLDKCDGQSKPSSGRNSRSRSTPSVTNLLQRTPEKEPASALARLPQLNYSLLKENALRKKLQDLGIPALGSKQLLIKRHVEWGNLWNSNCDSARPRTKRELLKDLDTWERSQGGGAPNPAAVVMKKDFDGNGWATSNKSQFDELIANARRKRTPVEKVEMKEDAVDKMETTAAETREFYDNSNLHNDLRRPSEGNEDALSIIREKADQANLDGLTSRSIVNLASRANAHVNTVDEDVFLDAPRDEFIGNSLDSPLHN
ncbi:DNA repair protein rad18 [Lepidopterella palustris CBS 459.81]|uniref:Postreplication repair E3 ubiquitin-protein ligase RAD18 n=1 Tax=Lepidopterella palustris CBS 459.81 TaxID=1314670 RepID=A0A8E2EGQ1_9PEZI|nr:DNA repair protein rad18 [Lepidopterella palustris CBS 459.81]